MTQQETKYNGWKNYETWATNLWLMNEEQSYNHIKQMAKKYNTYSVDPIWSFASALKTEIETLSEELGLQDKGLFTDLINASLSEVDWYELATK